MFNTHLVLFNPDLGFVAIDGPFYEYTGFDLSEATFIHCTTPEEIEYVQYLDVRTFSFLSDDILAMPFGAKVVEAKDLKV